MAITVKTAMSTAEAMNSGFRRSSRQASAHGPAARTVASAIGGGAGIAATSGRAPLSVPDSRVEDGVEHVDQQVGEDEDQDQGGDDPDHRRVLLQLDGAERLLADPR